MTKVITYGTFDLFHEGHYKLLQRAKALGDYLIVAVTSDYFDKCRGKFNVHDSLMTRVKNVEKTGFADEIIIEEYFGQKIDDIKKYGVDIFTVGSDWVGYFDYLSEYCKVVYLDRTQGISSTQIRNSHNLKLGIIGNEDILKRFLDEFNYVSGIEIAGIYCNNNEKSKTDFKQYDNVKDLLGEVDAVYINLPLKERYKYIKGALLADKHVLTEFPFCSNLEQAKELLNLANSKKLVVMEGLKTAYCPAFGKLISLVKSGVIGKILSVEARFTQILGDKLQEQVRIAGGSIESLAAYPLLAIFKLLGTNFKDLKFVSSFENKVDIFSKIDLVFDGAVAGATVAINAKAEGNLVITGTKGYIYVPAPWWKTDYFEVRYEDINRNTKYFYKFEGEGLRYELVEFVRSIQDGRLENFLLTHEEMMAESKVINDFLLNKNNSQI